LKTIDSRSNCLIRQLLFGLALPCWSNDGVHKMKFLQFMCQAIFAWVNACVHGRPQEFSDGENILGGNFEIYGTGTNEGAENKNRAIKSVNILIRFKFLKVIFIVS